MRQVVKQHFCLFAAWLLSHINMMKPAYAALAYSAAMHICACLLRKAKMTYPYGAHLTRYRPLLL